MPLQRIGSAANSTHQPDWEPEGGWDNTTSTADFDDGRKVTRYADGTQRQVDKDGRVVIVYGGTEWKQYCECSSVARSQWMVIGALFAAESAAQTALFYRVPTPARLPASLGCKGTNTCLPL